MEIDPDVVDAAYKWFELPRDDRLDVEAADGRRYLVTHDEQWDAIVIDAFYSDSIPFHLATREFMQLVNSRLAPSGVVVTNMIGAMTGDSSRLLRSLARTYREVFPTLSVHPVYLPGDGALTDETRNVILVATEVAEPSRAVLAGPLAGGAGSVARGPGSRAWRSAVATSASSSSATCRVLTDDYAPTDSLLLLYG